MYVTFFFLPLLVNGDDFLNIGLFFSLLKCVKQYFILVPQISWLTEERKSTYVLPFKKKKLQKKIKYFARVFQWCFVSSLVKRKYSMFLS